VTLKKNIIAYKALKEEKTLLKSE